MEKVKVTVEVDSDEFFEFVKWNEYIGLGEKRQLEVLSKDLNKILKEQNYYMGIPIKQLMEEEEAKKEKLKSYN